MDIEIPFLNKVTIKDKAFMARQLATMLESGLTIDKALSIFINQTRHTRLKKSLSIVLADIEGGVPFSDALKKHPEVFDRVFVNIVISGEAVGRLAEVLNKLAFQLEKQASFFSQIQSALYYPSFVISVMIVIAALMIVKVIPPLKETFEEFNSQLPWTTRSLLNISNLLAQYWWAIIIVLVIIAVLVKYYLATYQGRVTLAKIQIGFPTGVGKDLYMTRFTQTLSMLIHAGTPIIKALEITSDVMNNIIYEEGLKFVAKQMERGIPLSIPLEHNSNFDILVPQMVSVGEETGQLDQVLENLAKYFEEQVNNKVKNFNSLVEPALIVLIGLGVAFIVFSIIMPIYQLAQIQ